MTFEDFDDLIKKRQEEYFKKNPLSVHMSGAGIDWLTSEEKEQLHKLKMSLPTFEEERELAIERLKIRRKKYN